MGLITGADIISSIYSSVNNGRNSLGFSSAGTNTWVLARKFFFVSPANSCSEWQLKYDPHDTVIRTTML